MSFTHRLPVVLSSGMLLSASLLAVAQEVPRATRGATTPVLTGTTLGSVESMDGGSYTTGFAFASGRMTVNTLNNQVLLGSPKKVFSNNGNGSFSVLNTGAPGTYQIPDVNLDLVPDYVVGGSSSAQVFLANFDGTLGATPVAVPPFSGLLQGLLSDIPVVSDFSGAGSHDLVVITSGGLATSVSFLKEGSAGTFDVVNSKVVATIPDSALGALPVVAAAARWSSTNSHDLVFASTSVTLYSSVSNTTFSLTVRSGQSNIPISSIALPNSTLQVVSLTTGDIDGDGLDEIAVILSASDTDLTSAITYIYKGGDVLATEYDKNAFVIVQDVTGDGLADIVGSLPGPSPVSTTGLFPGRATFMDRNFGALNSFYASTFTASRTFTESFVSQAGTAFRPQAVPLLTPDVGADPLTRQLLLVDYTTALAAGSSPLRPKVIPALPPSFAGVSSVIKQAVQPNVRVTVCDPGFQMVFGDSGSTIDGLVVTVSSSDPTETMFFNTGTTFGFPVAGNDPVTSFNTFTFTGPGTVAAATTLLKSIQFATSSSNASFTRFISVTTKASFSSADVGSPYASKVEIGQVTANFMDGGSLKAGGTVAPILAFNPSALAARGIPFGASGFAITKQGVNGTASISTDGFGNTVLNYTSSLFAGAGTDVVTVDYQIRPLQREPVNIIITNLKEILQLPTVDVVAPAIGKTSHLRILNGHAPYQVTVQGGALRRGTLTGADPVTGTDWDTGGTGSKDLYQDLFVTPTNPFNNFTGQGGSTSSVTVTVTDADGTVLPFNLSNVAAAAVVSAPAPQIPVSVGGVTLFGAICPSTFTGVQSLRSALAGKDKKTVRAFAWDAASQSYAELPETEPAGGLQPTTGVFLATRENLGLDFSGVPSGLDASIQLFPGWNFVGLGPIDNAGTIERTHPFNHFDIVDDNGVRQSQADISSSPFYWDGKKYSTVSVMDAGSSYWIFNRSGASRQLIRKGNTVVFPSARTVRAADSETPPAPPSNGPSSASNQDDGGGCGSGSGIALVLGGLLAFARFARFRR